MRFHRKRKLIEHRKMSTICEKHYFFAITPINYSVLVCFYVCRNSCGYPRKNAYVCTALQNSQDTVNCLEYVKKLRKLTKQ